jgi:hypothetical protein
MELQHFRHHATRLAQAAFTKAQGAAGQLQTAGRRTRAEPRRKI